MRVRVPLLAAALAALSFTGQAFAHARLIESIPAADSSVGASPTEINLRFNEPIEARFSGIDLSGPDGAAVSTGATASRDHGMTVPVQGPLVPGVYHVGWHALSADGHKLEGSFKFEVRP